MAERIEFHAAVKGSWQQNEDFWALIIDDDGRTHVEHYWSYVDPYGKKANETGTQKIPIDEYLNGGAAAEAKEKLKSLLADKGIS